MRITDKATIANLRNFGLTVAGGLALTLMLALTANASPCQQSDGQWGQLNGTTADDAGCITEAEYAELFSVDNLVDTGVLTDVVDNGDGIVTGVGYGGGIVVLISDPLERPVAANTNPASPAFESDTPTVREILFPFRPLAWR